MKSFKILGFNLNFGKETQKGLSTVGHGFMDYIKESFTGAWQRNVEVKRENVLAYSAVFACITLIAGDIGKLRPVITERLKKENIDIEILTHNYISLLKRPNQYQTWQKFIEQWVLSLLTRGNAFVFKNRDSRGQIVSLHVLDPNLCRTLVAESGDVYYSLSHDSLAQVIQGLNQEDSHNLTVPATEIIHDRMLCLFHPLVGVSPIYACGLAATQGLAIQNNSATFFNNMSRPSGMLTAPGEISDVTAARLKKHWEENYSGGNIGKLAVLGDGLDYKAMTISAVDSQMIEQLKWTSENVCTCFHIPGYKIGVGQMPTYNSAEVLNQIYHTDCLQTIIQGIEANLKIGLGLDLENRSIELELDGLIRMDTATQIETLNNAVKGGWMTPNEARQKRNLKPVEGGDTPYMQQQNYSLSALSQRDKRNKLSSTLDDNNDNNDNNDNLPKDDNVEDNSSKLIFEFINKTKQLFEEEVY